MQSNSAKQIALGGMLAAAATVIMCLGGLVPVATYVCPMLCCMVSLLVFRFCGKRIAWVWYIVVSFLCLLIGPDKEAAMVFLTFGYYPLIKTSFEKYRCAVILKLIFFHISVVIIYSVMIPLLGLEEIAAENGELGGVGVIMILLLGNVTFILLDRLLTIMNRKLR